jgi:hypothetical protein
MIVRGGGKGAVVFILSASRVYFLSVVSSLSRVREVIIGHKPSANKMSVGLARGKALIAISFASSK